MGHNINFLDCDLYVEYVWHPPEKGSRDKYGAPLEPSTPGWFEIDSVWLGGYDITDLMGREQIEKLRERIQSND